MVTPSFSEISHRRLADYVIKCSRHVVQKYENFHFEPMWQRLLASQAVTIAEKRMAIGGSLYMETAIETDGQYFDDYDVDASITALRGCINAAINTHADLCEDPEAESEARLIYSALKLASLSLEISFSEVNEEESNEHSHSIAIEAFKITSELDMAAAKKLTNSLSL